MSDLEVAPARDDADRDAARELILEYVNAPGWEGAFSAYLARQDFAREIARLAETYAPPRALLLVARVRGEAAGCVAFKPLEPPASCEMKRLWVRPRFRSAGVGEALVQGIVAAAAAVGYERMLLDTLPSMQPAQRLYARMGFTGVAPYCDNPVAGAVFMERRLHPAWNDVPRFGDAHPERSPVIRPSAYAIVTGDDGRIACVRAPTGLYLCGGGIEAGECALEAAMREAREECGLLVAASGFTTRAVEQVYSPPEGTHFEKRSVFFGARSVGRVPPTDYDHELEWHPPRDAALLLSPAVHRWAVGEWLAAAG